MPDLEEMYREIDHLEGISHEIAARLSPPSPSPPALSALSAVTPPEAVMGLLLREQLAQVNMRISMMRSRALEYCPDGKNSTLKILGEVLQMTTDAVFSLGF